jgi:hypothetical protein
LRQSRALLEVEWEGDIVSADQSTGIQVDGSVVVEVDGDFRELVLLGGRASDERIDQLVKLRGTKSRLLQS